MISADTKVIDITLIGQQVSDERFNEISKRLVQYRLPKARLVLHQTVIKELDEATLKQSLLADVLNSNQQVFDTKNKQLQDLQNELANLRTKQNQQSEYLQEQKKIFAELVAQYPQVQKLAVAKTSEYQMNADTASSVLLLNITSKKSITRTERKKISDWLKVRTGVDQVKLTIETH